MHGNFRKIEIHTMPDLKALCPGVGGQSVHKAASAPHMVVLAFKLVSLPPVLVSAYSNRQ